MFFKKNKKASSILEYAVLLLLFIAVMVAMSNQVKRVFYGRWKILGDTFGHSQQVTPANTFECLRYVPTTASGTWGTETWYEKSCFECCMFTGEDPCSGFSGTLSTCRNATDDETKKGCCVSGCASSTCNF